MTAKQLRLWRAAVNLSHAARIIDAAHDDLYRLKAWPLDVEELERLRSEVNRVQLKLSLECWPPGLRDE